MFRLLCLLSVFLTWILCSALLPAADDGQGPVFIQKDTHWADSVFQSMTPEQRIAQLFMVAAYSNKDKKHIQQISDLVEDYQIGGLIFFQGGPLRQAYLTNYYQFLSRTPLLIAMDAEWGLAMRLDSVPRFPRQMTLGAIQNDSLIYAMGQEIAFECKRLGVHVNFAPVADINNNPLNPIIGMRSFGEDKDKVTRKAIMYMKGMQDAGVLANAKHFPGHGDTESDSHLTLPSVTASLSRLDSLELVPFKEMIRQGLGSTMVAHLYIPAIDTTPNLASTLNKKVVTDLLKDKLQFKGLVFTDALNMKGVSKFYAPGVVDVKALLAGNDVLLFAEDVPTAIAKIKEAILNGEITQAEIDERCKKILKVKQWCGLDHYSPIEMKNLHQDLNNFYADNINRRLAEKAVTLLTNKNNILPLKGLDTLRIASLSLGKDHAPVFEEMLSNYALVKHFAYKSTAKSEKKWETDTLLNRLKKYDVVIVALNDLQNNMRNVVGLTPRVTKLLERLTKQNKVILDVFGNPYLLKKIPSLNKYEAVILSYEETSYMESYSAQTIFGGVAASGKLPVTASDLFTLGKGINTPKTRLKYSVPEAESIDGLCLSAIDSLILSAIQKEAFPGCQVWIARHGNVIYNKSFGYSTYRKKNEVDNSDLYDLASLTKILSSTLSASRLMSLRMLELDRPLGYYLPELKNTNKDSIILREILTHQGGLRDMTPYWIHTVDKKKKYLPGYYMKEPSDSFPYEVAENIYARRSLRDSIFKVLIDSPIKDPHRYHYTDVGYYFLQRIIENITAMPLDVYVRKTFYEPLGLQTLGYQPLERFPKTRIMPTEDDKVFRKQLLQGHVHDPGAALMGGVAGHAGLFSNAADVGVIMQLFLQKGEYGGVRYIDSNIVNECTRCQYCINIEGNRRGIGFDKPEINPTKESPVCECVSPLSFGHQGFTGTATWADPSTGIVYVFLSNRIYPDAENKKITTLGIRSAILRIIYEAMVPNVYIYH